MSLKLEVVLGDSHKPTRAIPRLIYLFSAEAEGDDAPTAKETDRPKETRAGVQFPEAQVVVSQTLSNKTKTKCLERFWGKVRLQSHFNKGDMITGPHAAHHMFL